MRAHDRVAASPRSKTRRAGGRQRSIRPDQEPLPALTGRQSTRACVGSRPRGFGASAGDRPSAQDVRFDAIGVIVDSDGALRGLDHIEAAW